MHASPLLETLEGAGGVVTDYHGRPLVRHFGDPREEYSAATTGVAVFDRSHRARLTVRGRAPGQMLNGVLTGRLPAAPGSGSDGVITADATYHAVLTPKGKMISDLVGLCAGDEEEVGYLLDVPVAGVAGLLDHFGKFLPPRFAKVEDVSAETASITLVGPEAASVVSRLALGLQVEPSELIGAPEHRWWSIDPSGRGVVVMRTSEVWPPAWTVYGPVDGVLALWRRAVEGGARPAGLGVWSTLRVEAGRPVFGTDMDDGTLPPEAGIVDRAIDQTKGCYTGQEVIVRIRDRGHVNRNLRLLSLGDRSGIGRGDPLLSADGSGKAVGEIRSSVQSPHFEGALALAYVRRGVESFLLHGDPVNLIDAEVDPAHSG